MQGEVHTYRVLVGKPEGRRGGEREERVCVCVSRGMWMHELGRVFAYLSSMPRVGATFSAASMAPLDSLTLSHKWQVFRNKVTEHKLFVLIASTAFV